MAARRSALRVSMVPPVSLGPEPACAPPVTRAAAARTVSAGSPNLSTVSPWPAPQPAHGLTLPHPAACPAGWFGPGCQLRCPCANDGHCHPATGHCSCAPGWTGLSCQRGGWPGAQGLGWGRWGQQEAPCLAGPVQADPGRVAACDDGHWGPDCSRRCTCSPGHGSCDAVSGLCVCEAGYTGPRCEQRESRRPQPHSHARARTHTHASTGGSSPVLLSGDRWMVSSPEFPQLPLSCQA